MNTKNLTQCEDCGAPISKRAERCPHCGNPLTYWQSNRWSGDKVAWTCCIAFILLVATWLFGRPVASWLADTAETVLEFLK